jgi:hypothetical protein
MTSSVPTHVPQPGGAQVQIKTRQLLSTQEINLLPVGPGKQTTPALAVSGVVKQATVTAGTIWNSQKTIVDQWTINQDRNSWIGVAGIGWQKLSTASDSGCVALTMIAANALVTKASVNYRTESDGMVHEIYVF